MRGRSALPVYVENAAEFLTTGNRRFTERSVVIYSSVSGNTKEMVQMVDKALPGRRSRIIWCSTRKMSS